MNKFIVFKVGIIILTAMVYFTGCKKEESVIVKQDATNTSEQSKGEKVVLGKKLENPYTVANMKRAYAELKREYAEKEGGDSLEEINIYTTNLYVRFLPNDIDEYNILAFDTTLEIFNFPLDYELKEGGTYYHDPALAENQITWQYCAPKAECELPEIEIEIIEELYLPQEDTILINVEKSGKNIADLLEMKALQITANLSDEQYKKFFEKGSKWHPSGNIQFYDDSPGVNTNRPLVGAKARVFSWFHSATALTDAYGNFYISETFRDHVNYSIKWERADYDLRDERWGQAYYNGPRRDEQSWNLVINYGLSRAYAAIHSAAHHYFYQNIDGLRRPPRENEQIGRITIGVFDWNNAGGNNDAIGGDHLAFKRFTTFPEIRIFRINKPIHYIYGVTIHELAHASHWQMSRDDFRKTDTKVQESWARGVQWYLTKMKYKHYWGGGTQLPEYTQVVVDMLDDASNQDLTWGKKILDGDKVSGYKISEIEGALKGQHNWNSWRDNIKNKIDNGTEENLFDLFTLWN